MTDNLVWDLNLKLDTRALWAVGLPSSLLCYLSWNFTTFVGRQSLPATELSSLNIHVPNVIKPNYPSPLFSAVLIYANSFTRGGLGQISIQDWFSLFHKQQNQAKKSRVN